MFYILILTMMLIVRAYLGLCGMSISGTLGVSGNFLSLGCSDFWDRYLCELKRSGIPPLINPKTPLSMHSLDVRNSLFDADVINEIFCVRFHMNVDTQDSQDSLVLGATFRPISWLSAHRLWEIRDWSLWCFAVPSVSAVCELLLTVHWWSRPLGRWKFRNILDWFTLDFCLTIVFCLKDSLALYMHQAALIFGHVLHHSYICLERFRTHP